MTSLLHEPVLLEEMLAALSPKENGVYVDATFGAGGYSSAIIDAADCRIYAFDRDPFAAAHGREAFGHYKKRMVIFQKPFSEMEETLKARGVDKLDGIVFDLGVSSMQLDDAARGFSFRNDGPLSMRMDGEKPDAGDVVQCADVDQLNEIFKAYGEERHSKAIARAIVKEREKAPIKTTQALAAIVKKTAPFARNMRIHPATRIFQALRIFVNDEFGELRSGLRAAERLLRPAGRLVAVTFHSLEDRIVKQFLTSRSGDAAQGSRHRPQVASVAPTFDLFTARPVSPSDAEIASNPRARSAKLRAAIRRDAPAISDEKNSFGVRAPLTMADMFGG